MKWFKERFSEASSWSALGGFLVFIGVMAKDENLPQVADTIHQNADILANGDYVTAAVNIAATLAFALGFGKREKR